MHTKIKHILMSIIFSFLMTGCCIPLLGPCHQEEYLYPGVTKSAAVEIVSPAALNEPFGTAYLYKVTPESTLNGPQIISAPTSSVYLPAGKYRFSAVGFWNSGPARKMGPLPISCYVPLKQGRYILRALRQVDSSGMQWAQMIIQEPQTKEVLCLASPGATIPVPDWVKNALKNETK